MLQYIVCAFWILVKEWFQRMLREASCKHPNRDSTATAQKTNLKERLMLTLSRSVTKPSTKKASAPTSRTEVYVAATVNALCHPTPSAVSRDRRSRKPSDRPPEQQQQKQKQKQKQKQPSAAKPDPSRAAARSAGSLASRSRPLSEPLSADDVRSDHLAGVGDESDGGDILDDVIRDPVTLEVRHACGRRAQTGKRASALPSLAPVVTEGSSVSQVWYGSNGRRRCARAIAAR